MKFVLFSDEYGWIKSIDPLEFTEELDVARKYDSRSHAFDGARLIHQVWKIDTVPVILDSRLKLWKSI